MNEEEVQKRRREGEEKAAERRAELVGLPYIDTRSFEDTVPLLKDVFPIEDIKKYRMLPLEEGDGYEPWRFMITSETPRSRIDAVAREYGDRGNHTVFLLISGSAYKKFLNRYDPPKVPVYDDIKISSQSDSLTYNKVSQDLDAVSADRLFDFLIEQAEKLNASDIHIENLHDAIRIRMRVDGLLHPVATINKERYRTIFGELASRADISLAATAAQSGSIRHNYNSHVLNIRVETIPTLYGQDAVLRLFNFDEHLLNLDLLGLGEHEIKTLKSIISHPRGLVLLTGPTGSGKSTTLYSIINALNTPERKIITLEDPVEYSLTGISQIPVSESDGNNSFADGLRSVLRLDPDVVMIGEIRDAESARVAVQASITGHLVLSTLHANTASAAFSRIIDLIGVNPIFSSAVQMVISQRLARKLAPNKEAFSADVATANWIREHLRNVDRSLLAGIDMNNITLYKPVASDEFPFGFRGRTALMEQLVVSEPIQRFIRGDLTSARAEDIEKAAVAGGMLTLLQKGIIAVLHGETTLEEIMRII
ncbi:MAG: GspE/PulE family protein [Candidatus Nomurabacteria bacterium]|jgi:type II secretory ATPase GspE/PulE/Tfp pilus assembly ATPase PilB-like protein|nr:GspE/PulE family protein [Candidatus Nomurabacteria bacterium]